MWDYFLQENLHMVTEFGIGIVGIGALFFAYGSVENSLKNIIALIGFIGSFVITIHIIVTGMDFWKFIENEITNESKNKRFFEKFKNHRKWREEEFFGIFNLVEVISLMVIFMAIVTVIWIAILIGLIQ